MSQDRFQLVYDGDDVRQGSMDVYDLAPALLSVGDLVRETNRFLNQDRANVSVQVRSDFQRGSFEIFLAVDQNIIEQARQALFGGNLVDAQGLINLIFGHPVSVLGGTTAATAALMGVIKLYKMLKGQKPRPVEILIQDNSTTIIQDIKVNSETAQLYLNDAIRSRVDRVVQPITKQGIDSLEVRKGKEVIDRIEKPDVPDHVYKASRESRTSEVLSDTREALLKVTKANFEKGKWGFSDGTAKFGADVNDADFQRKLDNREIGFYKGDVLRVLLKTTQTAQPTGNFRTQYTIERVLEHRALAIQSEMTLPLSKTLPPKK